MTTLKLKRELAALLRRAEHRHSPNTPGWWLFQDRDEAPKPVRVSDPESEHDDPETIWVRLPIEVIDLRTK